MGGGEVREGVRVGESERNAPTPARPGAGMPRTPRTPRRGGAGPRGSGGRGWGGGTTSAVGSWGRGRGSAWAGIEALGSLARRGAGARGRGAADRRCSTSLWLSRSVPSSPPPTDRIELLPAQPRPAPPPHPSPSPGPRTDQPVRERPGRRGEAWRRGWEGGHPRPPPQPPTPPPECVGVGLVTRRAWRPPWRP